MSAPNSRPGLRGWRASGENDPNQGKGVRDTHDEYRPAVDRYARDLITRIQQNPGDVEAIRELADHYVSRGDHPSLANLMEGWGDTLTDATAAANAYLEAADATLLSSADRIRARVLYERALSRDAAHTVALDRVLRLLEDASDFGRMKQVLKYVAYQLEQREVDPLQLASVQYRLGQVYELRFDEAGKAVACYRKAIEANPKLVPALHAARRIYTQVGNSQAIALLYELEIDATPEPDDKRALLTALAELRRDELDDLNGAILTLRRALKLAPDDVQALLALGGALVARSERATAEEREIDRRRAAEVFYQLGRSVPRAQARPHLLRALELSADHEKAAALLRELSGHARDAQPNHELIVPSGDEPQVAQDSRATLRAAAVEPRDQNAGEAPAAAQAEPTRQHLAEQATAGEPRATVAAQAVQLEPAAEALATAEPAPQPTAQAPHEPRPEAQERVQRDSAAAWLDDQALEPFSALDTSELLPVSDETSEQVLGASSLPPELLSLDEPAAATFPSRELLRAPRLPALETDEDGPSATHAARSTPSLPPPPVARVYGARSTPPPPAATAPRSVPAAPQDALRPSQLPSAVRPRSVPPPVPAPVEVARAPGLRTLPPPAYAEIPGAASDDFTPTAAVHELQSSAGRRSRPDPTIIGWRLPDDSQSTSHPSRQSDAQTGAENQVGTVQSSATRAGDAAAPTSENLPPPSAASTRAPEPAELASNDTTADAAASARLSTRVRVTSEAARRKVAASTSHASVPTTQAAPLTRGASTEPAARTPSVAPSRVRAALDDRLSALSRVAREQASTRRQAPLGTEEPRSGERRLSVAPSAPDTAAKPARQTHASEPSVAPSAPRVQAREVAECAAHAPAAVTNAAAPSPLADAEPAAVRATIATGELPHDGARAEIEVNVGATTDSNFYVGFSNRLADGGLFVATYNPSPTGAAVSLLVTLPGNFQGRAHGRVRLTRDSHDPFSDDVPGMCVEFEALSDAALSLFERFAQKRAPLFIED
jgi:tetratricopeptide (TPR) repeat protein